MVGYYYPPEEPTTNWDKYYSRFEMWLHNNYSPEEGLVFGMEWDDACQSEDLLNEFIDWYEDRSE